MGSVILWMFMYGSPRDYVQAERFSSVKQCELFAKMVYQAKKSTDVQPRHHICFDDSAFPVDGEQRYNLN